MKIRDPQNVDTPSEDTRRSGRGSSGRATRSSGSFLVRAWLENREIDGEVPSFRGYIKNLATGEERFVHLPDELGAEIARSVTTDGDNEDDT